MLHSVTGLPMDALSSNVGRIVAPVSLIVPAYLILVMGGIRALRGVAPAAAVCGLSFASVQFLVSNYLGPYLTDILASLSAIGALVALLHVWRPADFKETPVPRRASISSIVLAWAPYGLLVILVLLWGFDKCEGLFCLDRATFVFWRWPRVHDLVYSTPAGIHSSCYRTHLLAVFTLNWLSAAGTSCFFAAALSAPLLGVRPS